MEAESIERGRASAIMAAAVFIVVACSALLSMAPPACAARAAKDKAADPVAGAAALTPEQAAALEAFGDAAAVGLPPGTELELVWVDGGWVQTTESGSGTGVGAEAIGDKLSESFDGSAPAVGLSGGGASSGGGAKRTGKASAFVAPDGPASNPLLWAGVLCMLGAGAALFFKLIRAAVISAAVGAVLIAAALYPALSLIAAAAAIGIGVVVYLRSEQAGQRSREALRAVVAGVEAPSVPESAKAAVKDAIGFEADPIDRRTIDRIKETDRIGKYAPRGA